MNIMTDESSRPSDHADICQTVISEVAATNGVNPLELDQTLNDVIDPDALEKLFGDRYNDPDLSLDYIEFTFSGCNVVVRSHGNVTVSSLEEASASDTENGDTEAEQESPK